MDFLKLDLKVMIHKGVFYVMSVGGCGGACFQSSPKNNTLIYNRGGLEGVIVPLI